MGGKSVLEHAKYREGKLVIFLRHLTFRAVLYTREYARIPVKCIKAVTEAPNPCRFNDNNFLQWRPHQNPITDYFKITELWNGLKFCTRTIPTFFVDPPTFLRVIVEWLMNKNSSPFRSYFRGTPYPTVGIAIVK